MLFLGMKSLLTFVFTLSFIGSASSQTLQKLSLGVQGGANSPTNIYVEGSGGPYNFQKGRTTNISKGIFLQYELPRDFYLRGTFKTAALDLQSTHSYVTWNALSFEGTSTVGLDNKQYELSLGYRLRIKKGFSLTGNLGATYLNFKRGDVSGQFSRMPASDSLRGFETIVSTELKKERSVLINSAVGLEYKTRRDNAFLLEVAYYKGFATAVNYNFAVNVFSPAQRFESSLKTKGDYAEIRLGYRMPLQKFTNLYAAIKRPRIKAEPEPDYLKEYRFKGRYWGLETAKQTFFSDQVQQWPDRTDKMQPSFWSSYLTYLQGYRFKSGFIAEGGLRVGAGGVQSSAKDIFGMDSHWPFLMFTAPVSVKYAVPLLRDKIYLTPEAGLWLSYSYKVGEVNYRSRPTSSGPYTDIVTHLRGLGRDFFNGYHAGLSLNGQFGKNIELGFGYRYADSFNKEPIGQIQTTYNYNGVPQPAILSTTRLRNDAFTISFRKFLRSKLTN